MAKSFVCRAILGLGITSVTDFVRLMSKYKVVREAGIDYITAATFSLPKKKTLLVFDSIKQLIRFHSQLKSDAIVVVSDTPVILKEIKDSTPLDYSNDRSFEFNFKEIDVHEVLKVLRSKNSSVSCKLVSHDNLGYHVTRIKSSGELINAYIALTSSMPYDKRSQLREATVKFFTAKKVNTSVIKDVITSIGKHYTFSNDVENFITKLDYQADVYHSAVTSPDASAIAAKKFDIDPYAVSYFRKLINQKVINTERLRKNDVKFKQSKATG